MTPGGKTQAKIRCSLRKRKEKEGPSGPKTPPCGQAPETGALLPKKKAKIGTPRVSFLRLVFLCQKAEVFFQKKKKKKVFHHANQITGVGRGVFLSDENPIVERSLPRFDFECTGFSNLLGCRIEKYKNWFFLHSSCFNFVRGKRTKFLVQFLGWMLDNNIKCMLPPPRETN